MAGIVLGSSDESDDFLIDLFAAGPPANDIRTGAGGFLAVVLKRTEVGAFAIGLLLPDRRRIVQVQEAQDDLEIIADWRALGRRLVLPLAIGHGDGGLEFIDAARGPTARRRGSLTAGRRPRIAARRVPVGVSARRKHGAGRKHQE